AEFIVVCFQKYGTKCNNDEQRGQNSPLDFVRLQNPHACTISKKNHPIAIFQLYVGHECLVFEILRSDFIHKSLELFIADPRHTFCGVGIKDDVDKLYDHHGLRVGRIADLNDLARMATNGIQV
ncbi:hypothetical protein MIMGU_mgv11b0235911mg, partial [Erythranthe guttata]